MSKIKDLLLLAVKDAITQSYIKAALAPWEIFLIFLLVDRLKLEHWALDAKK
jgi:hypothetical protein